MGEAGEGAGRLGRGFPAFDGTLRIDDAARRAVADDFGYIVQRRPLAVLEPDSVDDVVRLIGFARRHGIGVAARGQGHSGLWSTAGRRGRRDRHEHSGHGARHRPIERRRGCGGDLARAARAHAGARAEPADADRLSGPVRRRDAQRRRYRRRRVPLRRAGGQRHRARGRDGRGAADALLADAAPHGCSTPCSPGSGSAASSRARSSDRDRHRLASGCSTCSMSTWAASPPMRERSCATGDSDEVGAAQATAAADPPGELIWQFDILRAALATATPAEQMVQANRRLFEQLRRIGGYRYPVGAIPVTQSDWLQHFGDRLARARAREATLRPGRDPDPGTAHLRPPACVRGERRLRCRRFSGGALAACRATPPGRCSAGSSPAHAWPCPCS